MSDNAAFIDQLLHRSAAVVSDLKASDVVGAYIDASHPIPRPFVGIGPIRLVVVGQDPTVERLESRQQVKTVLTLDQKNGNLYRFVERICAGLGLSLEQDVYATNVCKNFFTELPERVKEPDLIAISWLKWRALLADELARFPGGPPSSHSESQSSGCLSANRSRRILSTTGVMSRAGRQRALGACIS